MQRRNLALSLMAAAATWAAWRRLTSDVDGVLTAPQVRRLYDRLSGSYDALATPYRWMGARALAVRGIAALDLQPGDTVVDLGCGTGALLPELARAVAPGGRVIGVDLSPGMLDQARARDTGDVELELVEADMRDFRWPERVDGVVSFLALEMVPEYDEVIAAAIRALSPRAGRIAVSGLRQPPDWPEWVIRAGSAISRPFGVHEDYTAFHPWESVRRHTDEVVFVTAAGGALYLSVGQAPSTIHG